MQKLRVLDLFSGIGGFSLGLERTGGFETVAFCEIEEFPRKVLAKHWPDIYCHGDVRTLNEETLCKGYAENAVLNRQCREMGGNLASVKIAIENIKGKGGKKIPTNITNGRIHAGEALLNIMAGNVPAVEKGNTSFWQLITSEITEAKNELHSRERHGKSLSSADYLTIIRFSVTTATLRNPSTVPAHIKTLAGVTDHDVRELTAAKLAADGIAIDAICGGFPCQDTSTAGRGAGIAGERSGLWKEYARLIGELRPVVAIMENVSALLGRGLDVVLGDLASIGYDAEWHCIPASAIGAPHRRDRIWIVAYPSQLFGNGSNDNAREQLGGKSISEFGNDGGKVIMADADSEGLERWSEAGDVGGIWARLQQQLVRCTDSIGRVWLTEPDVGRVAHGVSNRAHRLKALGNAVVPQVPELIGYAILDRLKQEAV